jgi:hypothetical protein
MSGFPSHVWRKAVCALPIPPAQKIVLIRLAEYADYTTGRDAWPGRQRLADDCQVSPSVVDRAVKAGKRHKVIEQTARGHVGTNPVFCLVAPDDCASAVTTKRVTTDNQSASLVTHLPTPIPTPNESAIGPTSRRDEVESSLVAPPHPSTVGANAVSDFSSTPRSSSPPCPQCGKLKSGYHNCGSIPFCETCRNRHWLNEEHRPVIVDPWDDAPQSAEPASDDIPRCKGCDIAHPSKYHKCPEQAA